MSGSVTLREICHGGAPKVPAAHLKVRIEPAGRGPERQQHEHEMPGNECDDDARLVEHQVQRRVDQAEVLEGVVLITPFERSSRLQPKDFTATFTNHGATVEDKQISLRGRPQARCSTATG